MKKLKIQNNNKSNNRNNNRYCCLNLSCLEIKLRKAINNRKLIFSNKYNSSNSNNQGTNHHFYRDKNYKINIKKNKMRKERKDISKYIWIFRIFKINT